MSHSECPPAQKLIDFCIGKLAEEEIDSVVDHLDHCSNCLKTVETLEKVPIPFVGFHLSESESQQGNVVFEPQFQRLLAALKQMHREPASS